MTIHSIETLLTDLISISNQIDISQLSFDFGCVLQMTANIEYVKVNAHFQIDVCVFAD
jgi:hypothetical protein